MKLGYANKNMLKFSFKRINILRDKHTHRYKCAENI
jgi:hypothetical protein